MLKHLLIKNYVLIEALEIAPSRHLNIVTGETGAGKSIMLGALGLLMGKRADSGVHYDPEQKCVVEGTFDLDGKDLQPLFASLDLDYENPTVVRREIAPNGKSRAFVNDTPANLDALRALGAHLMDVHSQHDTQQLGDAAFQLGLLDAYAQRPDLLDAYRKAYQAFAKADAALKRLRDESRQAGKEHEFNLHQLEELQAARLDGIDQQALEEELERLENAEQVKGNLNLVLELLSRGEFSVEGALRQSLQALQQLSRFGGQFRQLQERTNSMLIELLDVNLEVEREESELSFDYDRIQALKDRLGKLYTLQKKHGAERVEDLLALRARLQEQVERVLHFDEDLKRAQEASEALLRQALEAGRALSEARRAAIPDIEAELDALLAGVGIPNGRASMAWEALPDPAPSGLDQVSLLFSANKGIAPAPLKQVASGGEFSRLMLCIKYVLAAKTDLPTIIFDEIDTGVSGEVALRVGAMMEDMARGHQLVAITHLPQIASKGDTHYFVYKDHGAAKTISRIRKLTDEERVREIAQMIGGLHPTETAYQSAKELMGR